MRGRIVARDRRIRGTREHGARRVGDHRADGHFAARFGLARAGERLPHPLLVASRVTALAAAARLIESRTSDGLGALRRRRIAQAIDLRSQPSRVVGCDALEHAHALLELRDQRVALRERALEIWAARAPLLPVDRVTHLAGGPASLTRPKLPGRIKNIQKNIPKRIHIHGNSCIALLPINPVADSYEPDYRLITERAAGR